MAVNSWFVCKDKINIKYIKYNTGHCGLHCNELSWILRIRKKFELCHLFLDYILNNGFDNIHLEWIINDTNVMWYYCGIT